MRVADKQNASQAANGPVVMFDLAPNLAILAIEPQQTPTYVSLETDSNRCVSRLSAHKIGNFAIDLFQLTPKRLLFQPKIVDDDDDDDWEAVSGCGCGKRSNLESGDLQHHPLAVM